MSGHCLSSLIDWTFRLIIIALALLWFAFPPQGAVQKPPLAIERAP